MHRFTIELTQGTYQKFAHKCVDEDKSYVEAIREMIGRWLREK